MHSAFLTFSKSFSVNFYSSDAMPGWETLLPRYSRRLNIALRCSTAFHVYLWVWKKFASFSDWALAECNVLQPDACLFPFSGLNGTQRLVSLILVSALGKPEELRNTPQVALATGSLLCCSQKAASHTTTHTFIASKRQMLRLSLK